MIVTKFQEIINTIDVLFNTKQYFFISKSLNCITLLLKQLFLNESLNLRKARELQE
jgi:hypothetical protein